MTISKVVLNIELPCYSIQDKKFKKGKKSKSDKHGNGSTQEAVSKINESKVPIDVVVTLDETLPQLIETLGLIPRAENFTNYSIYYKDINLSNLSEFITFQEIFQHINLTIEDDMKVDLKIVEKNYNLMAVYEHLNRFRQVIGLHFLDKHNDLLGVNGGLSKFNELKIDTKSDSDTIESSEIDQLIESISVPTDFHNHGKLDDPYSNYVPPVKLYLSQWNPVPHLQKTKGDLLYLTVTTLEHETFHITCHATGFFINSSTSTKFNPLPKNEDRHFLLFNLICSVSGNFEKQIVENTAVFPNTYSNPEIYLLPSNVNYPWITAPIDYKHKSPDLSFVQLPSISNGVDGGDFVKDWNDEFQSIKELPKLSITERILREKLIMKCISDFNNVASKTAIEIVNGSIPPMNYSDDISQLTYLRNGIFYSHAIDNGNFVESGGDEASRYVSSKDLNSIRLMNRLDLGICSLLTCVVDYLGKRIVCQAPVPGIFNSPHESTDVDDKVAYGLNTSGTKVNIDSTFVEPLTQLGEAFHLKPHKVQLPDEDEVEVVVSKDIKGIQGTDDRKYVIDLYRTSVLDLNFLNNQEYIHKEPLIRHEAIEEWWKRKIASLFKAETEILESKQEENGDKKDDEKPQILIQGNQVSINPDTFTGTGESDDDKSDAKEISEFVKILIDEFLDDTTKNLAPFDGKHLSTLLHRSGINIRYLGHIADLCQTKKEQELTKLQEIIKINEQELEAVNKKGNESKDETKEETKDESKDAKKEEEPSKGTFQPIIANYESIYRSSVNEMVSRGAKHVLRKLSSTIEPILMPYFIAHFFNSLFELESIDIPSHYKNSSNIEFDNLTTTHVRELLKDEIKQRFGFEYNEWETLNKAIVFREISIKFGIQWANKNYFEEGQQFLADDVLNFVPIIKDSTYKSSILDEILDTAQRELDNEKEKDNKETLILFQELLTFHEQIYGRIHPETTSYYGFLSQLYLELNMNKVSSDMSVTSCILSERVFGIDSYNTITSYINAGYFKSIDNDLINSLKLYNHAIKIWSLTYGDDHPSFINTFANLAEILGTNKFFNASYKLFEKSIELCEKINGVSDITGLIHYRFGSILISGNNFKLAKEHFTKAYDIFFKTLGPSDLFTKKSLNFKTNLNTYIEYQKAELKSKNNSTTQTVKPSKKKSKKKTTKINNEIANKSIDDILAFIEGK